MFFAGIVLAAVRTRPCACVALEEAQCSEEELFLEEARDLDQGITRKYLQVRPKSFAMRVFYHAQGT